MTTGDLDVAYVATGDLDVVDVATAEPEVADEVLRTSFPGLELDLDPDAPPFRFTHRRVSDGPSPSTGCR